MEIPSTPIHPQEKTSRAEPVVLTRKTGVDIRNLCLDSVYRLHDFFLVSYWSDLTTRFPGIEVAALAALAMIITEYREY